MILEMIEMYATKYKLTMFMTKIQIYKLHGVIQGID